jgi:hypothetical protein
MPKSGLREAYDSSTVSFLRSLYADYHGGCTNLHSLQQDIRAPPPTPVLESSPSRVAFCFCFNLKYHVGSIIKEESLLGEKAPISHC